ncbi:MAG: hypothetical protein Q7S22_00375 [Candidatus Micrarchaeota archaeon]|nr:hypothetical protein [Candidatus Micrarchaeota archaeon]
MKKLRSKDLKQGVGRVRNFFKRFMEDSPLTDRLAIELAINSPNQIILMIQKEDFFDRILVLTEHWRPEVKKTVTNRIRSFVKTLGRMLTTGLYELDMKNAYDALKKLEDYGVDIYSILDRSGVKQQLEEFIIISEYGDKRCAANFLTDFYLNADDIPGLFKLMELAKPAGRNYLADSMLKTIKHVNSLPQEFIEKLTSVTFFALDLRKDAAREILLLSLHNEENIPLVRNAIVKQIDTATTRSEGLIVLDVFLERAGDNQLIYELVTQVISKVCTDSVWYAKEAELNTNEFIVLFNKFADMMAIVQSNYGKLAA